MQKSGRRKSSEGTRGTPESGLLRERGRKKEGGNVKKKICVDTGPLGLTGGEGAFFAGLSRGDKIQTKEGVRTQTSKSSGARGSV